MDIGLWIYEYNIIYMVMVRLVISKLNVNFFKKQMGRFLEENFRKIEKGQDVIKINT